MQDRYIVCSFNDQIYVDLNCIKAGTANIKKLYCEMRCDLIKNPRIISFYSLQTLEIIPTYYNICSRYIVYYLNIIILSLNNIVEYIVITVSKLYFFSIFAFIFNKNVGIEFIGYIVLKKMHD